MDVDRRRQTIENVGFALAIGVAAAFPLLVLVLLVGKIFDEPLPTAFMAAFNVVTLAIPVVSLSGIVTRHFARRREWRGNRAGYALTIGCWMLASLATLTVLGTLVWVATR